MQEHKSLTGLIFNVSYPVNLSLAFNINNNELFIETNHIHDSSKGRDIHECLVNKACHAPFGPYL